MALKELKKFQPGEFVTAEAWNDLVDAIKAMAISSVSPPLTKRSGPAGTSLTCDVAIPRLELLTFLDAEDGGGFYTVRTLRGVTNFDPTQDVDLQAGLSSTGESQPTLTLGGIDSVAFNVEETGLPTHWLRHTSGFAGIPPYGNSWGLLVGKTDEETPRPLYMVCGGVGRGGLGEPFTFLGDSQTWQRNQVTDGDNKGDGPVQLQVQTLGITYDIHGEPVPEKYRVLSFSADGRLVSIRAVGDLAPA